MGPRKGYKRKNSEKRKEKSRDAARTRRSKECEIFNELSDLLPIELSEIQELDRASVMRLAISHLKLRKLLGKAEPEQQKDLQHKLDTQYGKALDGFVLVIDREGDIVYISESVSTYLGMAQIELIGQSIYDVTHPCDHEEIQEILMEKTEKANSKHHVCNFLMRMKCTLTSKGRNINVKSAKYKVIHCSGRHASTGAKSQLVRRVQNDPQLSCIILIGETIPHPSNIEAPLDSHTFISRHSLDMKFTDCDERVKLWLGYYNHNLVDQSLFDYHHAMDSANIQFCLKELFCKGQAVLTDYRFLVYGGGYARMQTEATIINNPRTDRPQYVVCVNYVLSGVQDRHIIMSPVQMGQLPLAPVVDDVLSSGLIPATETIFAPRPSDAYDDMLCITRPDGQLQILNDLLELAPSAGSVFTDLPTDKNLDDPIEDDLQILEDIPPRTKSITHNTNMKLLDLSFLNKSRKTIVDDKKSQVPPATGTVTHEALEEIDFDLRAPYIPMDGSSDLIFDNDWVPTVDEDMFYSRMIGITESVFEPKPPEEEEESKPNKIPFSILRLQANKNIIDVSNGEISRNAGRPKMKRPMETNRMETGPPKHVHHIDVSAQAFIDKNCSINKPSTTSEIEDILKDTATNSPTTSVLENLLTKGEDINHGYRVTQSKALAQLFNNGGILNNILMEASSDDDSDVEMDQGLYDFSLPEIPSSSKGPIVQVMSTAKTRPVALRSAAGLGKTATVTSAANKQNNCTNLVVIHTDNTVMFAPIPDGVSGESRRVLEVQCN